MNQNKNVIKRNGKSKTKVKREQPKKDSASKRVNLDNARVGRVEKQLSEDAKKYNANDATEYMHNPTLVAAAGSLPYAPILGDVLYESRMNNTTAAVPGIMSLCFSPNFGPGAKPIAINQAADADYSDIVHANSRNTTYTAPDLMIVTYAGMEVFAILAAMIRAYGTAKAYREDNSYMPNTLLQAMGFDPINLRQNLSQAWFDINNLIDQSRQIWLPNIYPMTDHKFRLNTHIYTDADTVTSQIYVPVQARYFTYDETKSETGGMLVPCMSPRTSGAMFAPGIEIYSWQMWVSVAQGMISNLTDAEDRGLIYGDILKCYGAQSLYNLPSIGSDYTVYPEYNAEFLSQIENTTFASSTTAPIGLVQVEEDLYPLYMSDTISGNFNLPPLEPVINSHSESRPTPEQNMIMTRNMSAGYAYQRVYNASLNEVMADTLELKQGLVWISDVAGAEVFTNARIYTSRYNSAEENPSNYVTFSTTVNGSPTSPNSASIQGIISAFDWRPFVYVYSPTDRGVPTSPSEGQQLGYPMTAFGDFAQYSTVSRDSLIKLHNVAMYSLFGVPHM